MIGKTISHYRILEKLGEGGMGVVYKAEDTSLRRMVALKFLPPFVLGMGPEKARLAREAQAAAALDHPNICTIYEVDEVDGETFIAMALVDGGTLRDKISEGPLTLDEAMDLATQIAQGLSAAHGKGIIHRDIKPGNVMITSEGRAKILDFGLAKSPECTRLTMTGTTAGTVAYMSPEQTRGQDVDHRSDIWSFGVMFFEMLTGRRPFEGGHDQAVIHSILNDEPPSVSELRPDIPEGLERVVAGALVKSVEDRYQSIEDVLADLRLLGTVGGTATVPLIAPRPVRARRTAVLLRQWRPSLVAAATIIAVGIAGMAVYEALVRDDPVATGAQGPERVAVSVFDNRTGDPALDHIGQMAADRITEGLTTEELADVTAAGGSNRGAEEDNGVSGLLASARGAGASVLVVGSYRLKSDSLRVEARLLDVSDGTVLNVIPEAAPVEIPSAAVEQTRSRVMGAVAVRADPTILLDQRSHAPTYEAYLEYQAGYDAPGTEGRREHYERAAELDPGFTAATNNIASLQIQVLMGQGLRAAADSLIGDVLSRPGFLTPHQRLIIEAFAATNRGDHTEALRKRRELLEVEPDFMWAKYWCALSALRVNRPRETIEVCRPFLEQGPETESWVYSLIAQAYHRLGEFEREFEVTRQAIEAFPDVLDYRLREVRAVAGLGRVEELDRIIEESASTPVGPEAKKRGFFRSFDFQIRIMAIWELLAHGHDEYVAARAEDLVEWQQVRMAAEIKDDPYWPRFRLAYALYTAERWEEALALFEQMEPPDEFFREQHLCMLGVLAARTGDRQRALDIKQTFIEMDVSWEPGVQYYFAGSIAVALGEREEAVDLLHLAIAEGNDIWEMVHYDPDYAALRDYPPYQRFLEPRG